MCGVCGVVNLSPRADAVSVPRLASMADTLRHRGPDSDGYYVSDGGDVGLGFRRLSIVDLATGDQPMANEDETVWLVFNGEIYNHAELSPGPRGARPSLPLALRRRGHPAPLRGVRARLHRPPARHVRLRAVGQSPPTRAPGARSHRRQTAVLRDHARRVALRLRDQGSVRASRAPAATERGRAEPVPDLRRHARAAHAVRRRPEAAARPPTHRRPRGRHADARDATGSRCRTRSSAASADTPRSTSNAWRRSSANRSDCA